MRFHCDIEGCESVADGEAAGAILGSGVVPTGWAGISWMATRREQDASIKGMLAGIKAAAGGDELKKRRVKGVSGSPMDAMASALEGQGMRDIPVGCSALICPKCLSERLEFARFQTNSY